LIEEKKAKGPRKGRFGADPGRALGDHPDKGGPIVVKNGRYGPYVSHDGVNATLPTDITPDAITLEQAVGLIDARAARGGGKKKAAAKSPAGKSAASKARSNGGAQPAAAEPAAKGLAARPRSTTRKAPAKAKAAPKPKPPVVAAKKPARKAKAAE
jgi:DNA topoisomerase-1